MEPIPNTMSARCHSCRWPRVLLSTGVGRLHFVETAVALHEAGTDVRMITGWVPTSRQRWLANLAGLLLGRPRLADRLSVRTADDRLPRSRIHACATAEGIAACGHRFLRSRGRTLPWVSRLTWMNFGRSSRRFIEGADVFHVRSGAGQGGAIAAARRCGMGVVVDHSIAHPGLMAQRLNPELERHGMALLGGASDPFWSLVLQDCHEADVLLVNSAFVRDSFLAEGYDSRRIRIACLGVRQDFSDLKRDYRLHTPIRLLFTGGFGIRKGAATLLEVMALLSTRRTRWTLDVCGDATEIPRLAAVRQVPAGIRLRGSVLQEELRGYLQTSDIYVFPSLLEGCAKSAMEALAAGLPVIATAEAGLPVEHMKTAWIVPPANAEAVVEAVETLSRDASLRESLGRRAADLVRSRFRWSDYARVVRGVHEELLG